MNRTVYLCLLTMPVIIFGAIFKEDFPTKVFPFMPFYVAIITILRQRSMKMTWTQILKSPFSFKQRSQIFTKK